VAFAAERALAEHALSTYENNEPAEPAFPPVAHRIRRRREALGLTPDDVAHRWGEQVSMYWDLELYDEEAFTVISVAQLQRLAAILAMSVTVVLFGEDPAAPLPRVPYADVVAALRVCMSEDAVSIDQLGDRVGWDLGPVFADPGALGDFPVAGLWSVCRAAKTDWVAVISTQQPV
jgi:hypothetical protein